MGFSKRCRKCKTEFYGGFAKCTKCGTPRKEFAFLEEWLVEKPGYCVVSGAKCDVKLPNGDHIWAEYLLEFIEEAKQNRPDNLAEEVFRLYTQWCK